MNERENLQKIVCENEYHVQEWYPLVEELTFSSLFLDLTVHEAKNFVRCVLHSPLGLLLFRFTNLSVLAPTPSDPQNRKFVCNKEKEVELRGAMKLLEAKIGRNRNELLIFLPSSPDQGMKDLGCEEGAFVRLSSRSPKDAVSSKLYDLFLKEREDLHKQGEC